MIAPAAEVLVCPAEDSGRCDLAETEFHPPARRTHVCDFDEDHDGLHECVCGHRWTNQEED